MRQYHQELLGGKVCDMHLEDSSELTALKLLPRNLSLKEHWLENCYKESFQSISLDNY